MNKPIYLLALLLICLFSSCGEYTKILKSHDYDLKYEYAKKAFEEGKYTRSSTLLEELIAIYKGTDKGEESLYLLAKSYYMSKDYITASQYFTAYYMNYPKGEFAELSRYYSGYGYYLDSPEARLDQTGTYKAIEELQVFLEYYPQSEKAEDVQNVIILLQDKLAEKELYNIRLYYDLGNYMGNNYKSAIITAENALREYPYSKYREEMAMIILRSKYQEAQMSIDEKKEERYREVVDEYYSFSNDYPESEYMKEANRINVIASKYVTD